MANQTQQKPEGLKKWLTTRNIIIAVIVVVSLVFILQNTRTAHFNILWFDFRAPVWVWLVVIFAAGLATGYLLARHRAGKTSTS
jgi:uncharacterized integral membrane protein